MITLLCFFSGWFVKHAKELIKWHFIKEITLDKIISMASTFVSPR